MTLPIESSLAIHKRINLGAEKTPGWYLCTNCFGEVAPVTEIGKANRPPETCKKCGSDKGFVEQ